MAAEVHDHLATDSGVTRSTWIADADREPSRPPLSADVTCDVCVVGAGIAGLSVAYRLAKSGKRVVVLDAGPVAGGQSGRTTGFLNSYPDDGLTRLASKHDEQTAKLAVESYKDAINFIEGVCRDEDIDGGFVRCEEDFFVDPQGDDQDFLDKEMELANRIGWDEVRFADRARVPGLDTGRCLVFSNQAKTHGGRYLSGLATACERHGVTIHNDTRVMDLAGGDEPYVKTQAGHTVKCDWVVTCTCSPVNPPVTDLLHLHVRQVPYRAYAIAIEVGDADVPDVMYSDTAEPYHYVRPEIVDGKRVLIVGGEDARTAGEGHDDPARFDRLDAWARQRWPGLGTRTHAWSGQCFEPDDHLAFIGRDPGGKEHSLIATGDSGQGLTHGTLAALILGDTVLGVAAKPYASIYEPSRIAPKAALEFVKEITPAAAHYVELVTPGEVGSVDEIPVGEGRVIRSGLTKQAVYRDPSGTLHACTAICPHAGGVLHWNDMEKSWDCPVHGSRFAPEDGRCITPPAFGPLSKVDVAGSA